MNRSKQKGTAFERAIADYLATHVDDRIDRRVLNGTNDRGDIAGVRHHGHRIVLELKQYGGRLEPAAWIREAHTEMGNDDALAAAVIAKRRGTTNPGSQWVLMTVNDLIAFLTLDRPTNDL